MKNGTYIYWFNEHGEHIPGKVLTVRKRIKVRLNDHAGDRVAWVNRNRVEVQR